MTTHIALPARAEIFDGFGLTREIYDWLSRMVGRRASDMTDFNWNKRGYYQRTTRSRINPQYCSLAETSGYGNDAPYWLHFYFKDPSKAALFKLAWGGK